MLAKFLNFLREIFVYDEVKAREAYLAESTDIYDLEYRMRMWDKRVR